MDETVSLSIGFTEGEEKELRSIKVILVICGEAFVILNYVRLGQV